MRRHGHGTRVSGWVMGHGCQDGVLGEVERYWSLLDVDQWGRWVCEESNGETVGGAGATSTSMGAGSFGMGGDGWMGGGWGAVVDVEKRAIGVLSALGARGQEGRGPVPGRVCR